MAKRTKKELRGPKIISIPPGPKSKAAMARKEKFITNAVKISRAATKRAWLVSFKTAFHGRTLLDISLTGKDKPFREGFGPLVREVILADYAYPYRDPQGLPPAECAKARVEEIERLINQPEAAGRVAAILAEPVQGEAGRIVPPKESFPLLRHLCDPHGTGPGADEGAGRGTRACGPGGRPEEWPRPPPRGILQQLHPVAPSDQHPAPAHGEGARPARRQSRPGSRRESGLRCGWSAEPRCSRRSSPTTGI